MKNRLKKLIALSLGIVLCIATLCMGIYAIQNFKLEVTGVIDFVSYEKLVYIEKVELKNFVTTDDNGVTYVTQNKELSAYAGKYISNSENVTPIDISNIKVMNGEELTIAITMKSLSEDEIVVSGTNNTTSGITITYSNTTLPANPSGNVSNAESGVFTITIANSATGAVDLSDVKINISYAPVVEKAATIVFSPYIESRYFTRFQIRADDGEWILLSQFNSNDTLQFNNSISIKSVQAQDSDEYVISDIASAPDFSMYSLCLSFSINGKGFTINDMFSGAVNNLYKNYITFISNDSITLSNLNLEGSGGSNN